MHTEEVYKLWDWATKYPKDEISSEALSARIKIVEEFDSLPEDEKSFEDVTIEEIKETF